MPEGWDFPSVPPATSRRQVLERLGDLLPIMEAVQFRPGRDIVIATGSLIEGFGNDSSDIDLFIVDWTDNATKRDAQVFGGGRTRWVDVEYLDRKFIQELAARVQADTPLNSWHEGPSVSPSELDLYHRLTNGIVVNKPLVDISDWPTFRRAPLARKLTLGYYALARSRWLDAVGALTSRQYGQAWYVGREALERALDGYAAILGETNPSPKWLGAKLARLSQDPFDFRRLFWRVCCPPRLDEQAARRLLEGVDSVMYQVSAALVDGRFRERSLPVASASRLEMLPDGRVVEIDVSSVGRVVSCEDTTLSFSLPAMLSSWA